jgi:hypothetical protein
MGKNRNYFAIVIGFVAFLIFFMLMLGEYYLLNNLTIDTILISFFVGLFTVYILLTALMEQ